MATEWVRHIQIAGFRSIRHVDLDLHRFTILIGANGSGKSSFIDFFRMLNVAFSTTQGGLQLYLARKGGASSVLHYGSSITKDLSAGVLIDGDERWSRYSFDTTWAAPDDLIYTSETLEFQRQSDSQAKQVVLRGGGRESAILSVRTDNQNPWIQTVATTFCSRLRQVRAFHFHDTSDGAHIRVKQDVTREAYLLSDAGNIAAFLLHMKENAPECYRRILGTVQMVAPFIADFELEPEAANDRFVMLRWRDRSGEVFGPHQLSDGTLRAIALITALLQPDELLPSVMLFDEPELGLHPAAISLIAELMEAASQKRQVIVATQSPLFIRNYEPSNVVVAEREESSERRGSTTLRRLDPDALAGWLEDFDLGELYEKNVTGGYPQ
ncbi:MAG: AAA family ATPase [Armatimonadetes bacterium]|nr:AAA family ATPase [Armatimonadota bacterium]